jgi:hypothetical protein
MTEWRRQRDLLIEEALAFAQAIAADAPTAVTPVHPPDGAQGITSSAQRLGAVTKPAPADTLDSERIFIQKRLANFKAHQELFQRQREDYFQNTLSKARANQWTPQSRPTKIG